MRPSEEKLIKTHEGCRVCHGIGVETEISISYGKRDEVILSDPCHYCGGDGYDRVKTGKELDAAVGRFNEDNIKMLEMMTPLLECSNVIDS